MSLAVRPRLFFLRRAILAVCEREEGAGMTTGSEFFAARGTTSGADAELAKAVFESAKEEYRDAYDSWKALDSKAQATTAVSGVLLAAVVALVRDLENSTPPGIAVGLVTCTVLLLLTLGLAIYALLPRDLLRAPYGEEMKGDAINLLELEGSSSESRIADFYFTATDRIVRASADLHAKAADKVRPLTAANWFLLFAAGIVASVLVLHIAALLF
jgi:hypothetical protein